eukprot:TRINITY_DN8832_c0_g2_i2.p2 TRINITY_DN8832_c0_g2~~TRINITY_DN8832_c0_g2_i2.p2  ORF type:complete len:104 (+),score=5.32 TRINITY_DN8832_c0_g2_i2:181-492(+)
MLVLLIPVRSVEAISGTTPGKTKIPGRGASQGFAISPVAGGKAGLLTPGSPYSPRLPASLLRGSGLFAGFVPGHSGGSVPDSHRLPCQGLIGRLAAAQNKFCL